MMNIAVFFWIILGCYMTDLSNNFVVDTTLTLENSPYRFLNSLVAERGVTVTVDAGVVVELCEKCSFLVEGSLKILGSSNQKVVFTGTTEEPAFWNFIKLSGTNHVFVHAIFKNGGSYGSSGSMVDFKQKNYDPDQPPLLIRNIQFLNSDKPNDREDGAYALDVTNMNVRIENCYFYQTSGIAVQSGNLELYDSVFENDVLGVTYYGSCKFNETVNIKNCTFFNSTSNYVGRFDYNNFVLLSCPYQFVLESNSFESLVEGDHIVNIQQRRYRDPLTAGVSVIRGNRFDCNTGSTILEVDLGVNHQLVFVDNRFEGNYGNTILQIHSPTSSNYNISQNILYRNILEAEGGYYYEYDDSMYGYETKFGMITISEREEEEEEERRDSCQVINNNIFFKNEALFVDGTVSEFIVSVVYVKSERIDDPELGTFEFRNNIFADDMYSQIDPDFPLFEVQIGEMEMVARAVDIKNNYWGESASEEDISIRIYDYYEDSQLQYAKYTPFLTESPIPNFQNFVEKGKSMCQTIRPKIVYDCYWYSSDDPEVCGEHGKCVGYNDCECDEGWEGSECYYDDDYDDDHHWHWDDDKDFFEWVIDNPVIGTLLGIFLILCCICCVACCCVSVNICIVRCIVKKDRKKLLQKITGNYSLESGSTSKKGRNRDGYEGEEAKGEEMGDIKLVGDNNNIQQEQNEKNSLKGLESYGTENMESVEYSQLNDLNEDVTGVIQ